MEANRTDCWLTWKQPKFVLSVLPDWHMPIIKSICSSCLCPCCMCSMLSTKSQRFRQQQAALKAHGPWKRNFNSLSPRRPGSEIVSGLWVAVEKWVKFLHYSVLGFFYTQASPSDKTCTFLLSSMKRFRWRVHFSDIWGSFMASLFFWPGQQT